MEAAIPGAPTQRIFLIPLHPAKVFLFRAHGALPIHHKTVATIFQGCLAWMGSDFVGLTQEFLAPMLGTRRANVNASINQHRDLAEESA
jgi:hypothetical protein